MIRASMILSKRGLALLDRCAARSSNSRPADRRCRGHARRTVESGQKHAARPKPRPMRSGSRSSPRTAPSRRGCWPTRKKPRRLPKRAALRCPPSSTTTKKRSTTVNELLKQREGNLGELFGVTRQVAGDTANVMEQSIISAQYPDREAFLRDAREREDAAIYYRTRAAVVRNAARDDRDRRRPALRASGRSAGRAVGDRSGRAHWSVHDHVGRQVPVVSAVGQESRGVDASAAARIPVRRGRSPSAPRAVTSAPSPTPVAAC